MEGKYNFLGQSLGRNAGRHGRPHAHEARHVVLGQDEGRAGMRARIIVVRQSLGRIAGRHGCPQAHGARCVDVGQGEGRAAWRAERISWNSPGAGFQAGMAAPMCTERAIEKVL